ncbi:MAG: DUF1972 domain-containing protein [candidate division Zixibacteria bacterium]|nr:DUF1972 domain-containing protein [candidate division Zixibacteria bacterium]
MENKSDTKMINKQGNREITSHGSFSGGTTDHTRIGRLKFKSSRSHRKGRVAFCGTSGLPFKHGGFEKAIDELTPHFLSEGYDCDVFTRRSTRTEFPEYDEGRRLVYVDGSKSRKLDTFKSSIETGLHLIRHRKEYSHAIWFNNANIIGILLTALAGIPMTINTDGIEWKRPKWSLPFKAFHILSAIIVSLIGRRLVSDSIGIKDMYRKYFLRKSSFIPYGGKVPEYDTTIAEQHDILSEYDLEAGKYFLQITRFEPDNLPLEVARAFVESGLSQYGYKYVLIGYKDSNGYTRKIKSLDGQKGVMILNALYDPIKIATLRHNCYCYVHGNSVGGTNPALLEAMSTCPRIMAVDTVFSREVMGDSGVYFEKNNISTCFWESLNLDDQSEYMQERIRAKYDWEEVAKSYIRLIEGKPSDYNPLSRYPRYETVLTPAGQRFHAKTSEEARKKEITA